MIFPTFTSPLEQHVILACFWAIKWKRQLKFFKSIGLIWMTASLWIVYVVAHTLQTLSICFCLSVFQCISSVLFYVLKLQNACFTLLVLYVLELFYTIAKRVPEFLYRHQYFCLESALEKKEPKFLNVQWCQNTTVIQETCLNKNEIGNLSSPSLSPRHTHVHLFSSLCSEGQDHPLLQDKVCVCVRMSILCVCSHLL